MEERQKLTRKEAIEFCIGRRNMHFMKSDRLRRECDIENSPADKAKYDSTVELAARYGDIAELLKASPEASPEE